MCCVLGRCWDGQWWTAGVVWEDLLVPPTKYVVYKWSVAPYWQDYIVNSLLSKSVLSLSTKKDLFNIRKLLGWVKITTSLRRRELCVVVKSKNGLVKVGEHLKKLMLTVGRKQHANIGLLRRYHFCPKGHYRASPLEHNKCFGGFAVTTDVAGRHSRT